MNANCTECQEKFCDLETLKCHLGEVHFQYLPYECEICSQKFSTKVRIKTHCLVECGMEKNSFRTFFSDELDSKKQQIRECMAKYFLKEGVDQLCGQMQSQICVPVADQTESDVLMTDDDVDQVHANRTTSTIDGGVEVNGANHKGDVDSLSSESSSILSTINKIRVEKRVTTYYIERVSVLPNYRSYQDHALRRIGIEAEIHTNCLDQGSDITELAHYCVQREGVFPGDKPMQLIDQRLGGPGHSFNFVPLNAKIDLSSWEAIADVIYDHVKCNHRAHLLFAFDYDDENADESLRPIKIYYHFKLYDESGKMVDQPIEGVIDNISPRKVN